jgi:hypothetical protein
MSIFTILLLIAGAAIVWRIFRALEESGSAAESAPASGTHRIQSGLEAASARGRGHAWVGRVVEFAYRDAAGERSRRQVEVISVFRSGSQSYLHGYCRLRGAERFFRLERIVGDLVDAESGEIIERRDSDVPAGSRAKQDDAASGSCAG